MQRFKQLFLLIVYFIIVGGLFIKVLPTTAQAATGGPCFTSSDCTSYETCGPFPPFLCVILTCPEEFACGINDPYNLYSSYDYAPHTCDVTGTHGSVVESCSASCGAPCKSISCTGSGGTCKTDCSCNLPATPTPETCSSLGYTCGDQVTSDGKHLYCGTCSAGSTCTNGTCVVNPTPTPTPPPTPIACYAGYQCNATGAGCPLTCLKDANGNNNGTKCWSGKQDCTGSCGNCGGVNGCTTDYATCPTPPPQGCPAGWRITCGGDCIVVSSYCVSMSSGNFCTPASCTPPSPPGPTPAPTPLPCAACSPGRDPISGLCKTCPPSGVGSFCRDWVQNECPTGCIYLEPECEYGRCTGGAAGCYTISISNGSRSWCGQPTQKSYACTGKEFWPVPIGACNGQPINMLCSGSCSGGPTSACTQGGCFYNAARPKYCHSQPGDDATCGPWVGPACGGTQTRNCKATDCSPCTATRKNCDCNYTCGSFTTPVTCGRERDEYGGSSWECSGGEKGNAKDGCGNIVTVDQCIPPPPTPPPLADKTINGSVFVDINNNGLKDGGESNYTGSISISSTGGSVSTGSGYYSITGLLPNSYTVSSSVPSGYLPTIPTGAPPSWTVTVGPSCNPGGASSYGATCSGGQSISNLNFGINNSKPWMQCKDGDCRIDSGFTSKIPLGAVGGAYANAVGSGGTPGLVFTGNSSYDFGQGQASQNPYNWIVGGLLYPETYAPTRMGGQIKTSYDFLLSKATAGNIVPTKISTLSAGLPRGIYQIDGDLNLTGGGYTFGANQNYVILVKGNLTISERITVPNGSTALFSAKGNITVEKTVGETASSASPTIEGIYSADKSFIASGNNSCSVGTDLRLNVAGSVITNAALLGGSLQNQRDLCGGNAYPSLSVSARPDFILNAPDFLKQANFTYQEVAP